ncbi:MAG TPA: hypothetical protein VJ816_11395 [Gemmatimonadales bacterium]|nr:hypothetical protein [Gemmatimonadales bacterium]
MTHAEACRAAFDRAGLWHWVGEGRRLEVFLRRRRWMPCDAEELEPRDRTARAEEAGAEGPQGVSRRGGGSWETYG